MAIKAAELQAVVGADTKPLEDGMDRAEKKISETSSKGTKDLQDLESKGKKAFQGLSDEAKKQIDAIAKKAEQLQKIGQGLSQVGGNLTKAITLPLAAGAGFAIKSAIDFESAFAKVRKSVTGTEADFKGLEKGFRDLSLQIPVAAKDLAEFGATGGQLGIPKEALVGFTKTVSELGVTTNLVGDQAAASLAKIANVMGTSSKDFERMGSTIFALGNIGASTESEMVTMALRLTGAGKTAGATEADVLALANALSSMGLEAEAGGTAASKVISDMNKSVVQGGEQLKKFANVAGLTAEQFATQFKTSPVQAFNLFIQGLNGIKKSGGDVYGVLEGLGLQDVRTRDTLLRAANAGDLLTQSLNVGRQAWTDNTALAKGAEERFKTTASQMQLLKNEATEVGIQMGQALLPAFRSMLPVAKDIIGDIQSMVQWFANLPAPIQETIIHTALFAAALGPTISLVGSLITTIGSLMAMRAAMTAFFLEAAQGAEGFAGALNVVKASAAGVGAALLSVLGVMATVAAVAAVPIMAMNANAKRYEQGTAEAMVGVTGTRLNMIKAIAARVKNDFKAGDKAVQQTLKQLGTGDQTGGEYRSMLTKQLADQGKVLTQNGTIISQSTAAAQAMLDQSKKAREIQVEFEKMAGKNGFNTQAVNKSAFDPSLFADPGKTKKAKAAKESPEQQATKSLQDATAGLRRETSLLGDDSVTAAMKYDILSGQYVKATAASKQAALAAAALRDAKAKEMEAHNEYRDALKAEYTQTQEAATQDPVALENIKRRSQGMKDMTAAEAETYRAADQRRKATQLAAEQDKQAADSTKQARNELALMTDTSVENKVAVDVLSIPYTLLNQKLRDLIAPIIALKKEMGALDDQAKENDAITALAQSISDAEQNARNDLSKTKDATIANAAAVELMKKPWQDLTIAEQEALLPLIKIREAGIISQQTQTQLTDATKKITEMKTHLESLKAVTDEDKGAFTLFGQNFESLTVDAKLLVTEFNELTGQTEAWSATMKDTKAIHKSAQESMKSLTNQIRELTAHTRDARIAFLMLRDGMTNQDATAIVNLEDELKRAQKAADMVKEITSDITEFIHGAFDNLWKDGIGNFFNNVVAGFDQMLQKIAQKYLENWVMQQIFGMQGASGWLSGAFPGMKAEGGPVNAFNPYIVGEKGPELFVPTMPGHIVPNMSLSSAMVPVGASGTQKPGHTINISFVVTAPDRRGFDQSAPQFLTELGRQIRHALVKND